MRNNDYIMLHNLQKLPKVNKDLAEKLLEEEQRTDNNKKRKKVGLLLFLNFSFFAIIYTTSYIAVGPRQEE